MAYTPNTNASAGGASEIIAVGAVSAAFTLTLVATELYELSTDVALAWSQGSAPTASAAAGTGSAILGAGQSKLIAGAAGTKVAVIQDGALGGKASLTLVRH